MQMWACRSRTCQTLGRGPRTETAKHRHTETQTCRMAPHDMHVASPRAASISMSADLQCGHRITDLLLLPLLLELLLLLLPLLLMVEPWAERERYE